METSDISFTSLLKLLSDKGLDNGALGSYYAEIKRELNPQISVEYGVGIGSVCQAWTPTYAVDKCEEAVSYSRQRCPKTKIICDDMRCVDLPCQANLMAIPDSTICHFSKQDLLRIFANIRADAYRGAVLVIDFTSTNYWKQVSKYLGKYFLWHEDSTHRIQFKYEESLEPEDRVNSYISILDKISENSMTHGPMTNYVHTCDSLNSLFDETGWLVAAPSDATVFAKQQDGHPWRTFLSAIAV